MRQNQAPRLAGWGSVVRALAGIGLAAAGLVGGGLVGAGCTDVEAWRRGRVEALYGPDVMAELTERLDVLDAQRREVRERRAALEEHAVEAAFAEGDVPTGALREERAALDAREADAARSEESLRAYTGELERSIDPDDHARLAQIVDTAFLAELHLAAGTSLFESVRELDPSLAPIPSARCLDAIDDRLFAALFAALADDDRAAYVRALSQIQSSLACGSLASALVLQRELPEAIERTIAHFDDERLARLARRTLESQLLNAILLVHDQVKWVGDGALMRWLREHRIELGEIVFEHTSIVRLTGLWLHQPATDELVQLASLCEERAVTDCVSASHLLDALTDPTRLGLGTCAATEMVTPVLDERFGYVCRRDLCTRESGSPGVAEIQATGRTQFGVDLEALAATRCSEDGSGSWEGAGGGAAGVGGALPTDAVSCVSSYGRASDIRQQLTCMTNVLGQYYSALVFGVSEGAENPVGCSQPLAQDAGDRIPVIGEYAANWFDRYGERLKAGAAAAGLGFDGDAAFAALEHIQVVPDGTCPPGRDACTDGTTIKIEQDALDGNDDEALGKLVAHELGHVALKGGSEAKEHDVMCRSGYECQPDAGHGSSDAGHGGSDAGAGDAGGGDAGGGDAGSGDAGSGDAGSGDAGSGDAGTGDAGAGDAGTPVCRGGGNDCDLSCTPGGAMATAMMECTDPDRTEAPTRTGGCDPRYCDDIEGESRTEALGHCFGADAPGSTAGSLACAATSCGPGFTSGLENGACRCVRDEGGGSARPDSCATARCSDGSAPVTTASGCQCVSAGRDGFFEPGGMGGPTTGLFEPRHP